MPHERVSIEGQNYVDFKNYSLLKKIWRHYKLMENTPKCIFEKPKARLNASMGDLGYMERYKDKYDFFYTKSKWRTDYGELFEAKIP